MSSIELSKYNTYNGQNEYFGHFATIQRIYDLVCATPLVVPIMRQNWTIFKADGIQFSTSTNKTLIVETGFKVNVEIYWKWIHDDSYADPIRTEFSEINDEVLMKSNIESQPYTKNNITENKTFTRYLYKPNISPIIFENVITKPINTGELSSSVSCNVSFQHRIFAGITKNPNNPYNEFGGNNRGLTLEKEFTIDGISTQVGEYYFYMYPTVLGKLKNIIQNDGNSILNSFRKIELSIVNAAGVSIDYYAYVSVNDGAFKNDKLTFL